MIRVGPYELLGEIASGGMGRVYRARDPRTGEEVALKHLLAGRGAPDQVRRRFEREARVLSRLHHPNVVAIRDAGEHEGAPYLVTELVRGGTLEERLTQLGVLPLREAADLAAQLARALAYAHAQGVLHRDVKPANVLLDGLGKPRLTDFGLAGDEGASLSRSRLSKTGCFTGTIGYAAPEQTRGQLERIGPATDVYGLGATLYTLLTGGPPFRVQSLPDLLDQLDDPPPPLRRFRPEAPKALEAICLKCLHPEPERRYPSCDALADELQRFLSGQPTGPRSRLPWLLAAVPALALLALAGWFAFGSAPPAAAPTPHKQPAPAEQPAKQPAPTEQPAPAYEPGETEAAAVADLRRQLQPRGPEEVERQTTALLEQNPGWAGLRILRALLRWRWLADPRGAVEDCDAVLAIHPGTPYAWANRGSARLELSDSAEALADCQRALELDPESELARSTRAAARCDRGDRAGAAEDCARMESLAPGSPAWRAVRGKLRMAAGDLQGAIDDLEEANRLEPDRYRTLAYLAELRFLLGDNDGASQTLERALQRGPAGHSLLLTTRARLELGYKSRARGAADLDLALDRDPDHADALRLRVDFFLSERKLSLARADVDRALGLTTGPLRLQLLEVRARIHQARSANEKALRDLDEALGFPAAPERLYATRGAALLGLGRLKEARADLERALVADAEDPLARVRLGEVKVRLADHSGGLAELDRVLERNPGLGYAWFRRGWMLLRHVGDPAEARRSFQQCLRKGPQVNTELYVALTWLDGGDPARAASECARLERVPGAERGENARLLQSIRGAACLQLGDLEQARVSLDRALEGRKPTIGSHAERLARFARAELNLTEGDLTAARADCEVALLRMNEEDRLWPSYTALRDRIAAAIAAR